MEKIVKVFVLTSYATIPMKTVGPIKITLNGKQELVSVPLATFESPLWPSVARGAKLSRELDLGVNICIQASSMARSVIFQADNSAQLHSLVEELPGYFSQMQACVSNTSSYAILENYYPEIIGNQLFLRFAFKTGDAAGHNMVTKASDALMQWFLDKFSDHGLTYVSISGNMCTDKKVSAINSFLGRGVKSYS